MEELLKEKKIRWNVSKAMSCVYQVLNDSKLKIKKTKSYTTAMENLKSIYKLNQVQVWILCLACEYYFECDNSQSLQNMSSELGVPTMSIISWKKEIEILVEKGFLEHRGRNGAVQPVNDFLETIYSNIEYEPHGKKEDDDIEFISYMADRYESRRREDLSTWVIQRELRGYEKSHAHLEVIKRVSEELENPNYRFMLYDIANDVFKGHDSSLDATIADLYDGGERYNVATEMMEESHELFQKGLVEFTEKGNLADARFTLSDKGKKLVLGEKAFLFEDAINDKNLIKTDCIKEKKLFYSPENQKEIDCLKAALQEEKLKGIQERLKDDGLPVGVAILLYGAPGTGKTESVMQIAKETGRSIVHVDISEAKSAWFGESEKRIKKIFTSYKNSCKIAEKRGRTYSDFAFQRSRRSHFQTKERHFR